MFDVAIVGAGAAGSAAAAVLARAGIDVILVDPHDVYPPDFRCEKLDASQTGILENLGLSEVLDATTPGGSVEVVHFGRVVRTITGAPAGIRYDALVERLRAAVPARVPRKLAKVVAISATADRQTLTLSTGEIIASRLVVLANGLNMRLRRSIDIQCAVISPCHVVGVGFDLARKGGAALSTPALTYYPQRVTDQFAFMTLFHIGMIVRVNLFTYWGMSDPRLGMLREHPERELLSLMPRLETLIGQFELSDSPRIRPVDLVESTNLRRPGVALIGDAFATSCPAAGTGMNKVLTDVEQLCCVHIPGWLATPGMQQDKIEAYYDDAVKKASDSASTAKALRLRSLSRDPGLVWGARRHARSLAQVGLGILDGARERLHGARLHS